MTSTETTTSGQVTIPELFYFTKAVHHETYDRISPLRPEVTAHGKNVVVTGGGTGIGKAIAIAFAQAGAKSVSILGRREDRLKTAIDDLRSAATSDASVFQYGVADLKDRKQIDKALDSIVKEVGKIDILVSSAGVLPELGPLATIDASNFMKSFELNVLTALNAVQAFLPRAGPHPIIISVSSCIAHMSPMPNVSGYAVSKAANLKMMNYFAAENPNLHVVNLQPGTVATEMSESAGVQPHDLSKSSYLNVF